MKIPDYPCLIFIGVGIMALNGCQSSESAFSANTNAYMAKPIYQNQKAGAFYLSGRISQGDKPYGIETNNSGEVLAHFSGIKKHFFTAVGAFGYWGKYEYNASFSPTFNTEYVGGGVRAEMGGRIPFNRTFDLLVGLSGEMYREYYAEDGRGRPNRDFYVWEPSYFNIAPTLDLRFFTTNNWLAGVRYSLDNAFSLENLVNRVEIRYVNRFTVHALIRATTFYGQIGLSNSDRIVYSFGINYALPLKSK